MLLNIVPILFLLSLVNARKSSLQGDAVNTWAKQIGKELSKLSLAITRHDEIKQRYTFLNAKVGKKDPQMLLDEVKENISRMIARKTDAIERIQQRAEEVAEAYVYNSSFEYYSSKWSSVVGEPPRKVVQSLLQNIGMYKTMKLNNDTHFYNLAVNTNHSSVHVPTNVYDKEFAAAFAIQWSEALDEVFVKNYNTDPALSWQYFGSSSGIMRHYPAKKWEGSRNDLFDCRSRTWYIEAATCTKDVIILMDNSGSMKGMGHHIGSLTAASILDTFSNNDFINVLNYSETTNYSVPCFEHKLVQATKENINVFREAIDRMEPEGKTDIVRALKVAFKLLKDNREQKGCSNDTSKCNQAIMIITDGVNSNLSAITREHNCFNNGSNIPVRIFTYLVGKEVSNVGYVKWISCANRGYYTPVQTLEQVTASVLQYINVVARPLVLQSQEEDEHPKSWTHAYADMTYDDKNDNQINEPYRLLTSVAIPCYDTKINKMNDTRTAYLLGVAATDVPLEEFNKMMLPYKIGVNGYSFIVSNNGYVLMHPDLRPVFAGMLKENYNSVDLTQVEQHNDGLPARTIGSTLEKLRQLMVDGEEGNLHDIDLSYHYDGIKRISEEKFDYYFTPLEQTPFTIGIAIPNIYGNYSLEVGDEILRNRHTGENLKAFFNGKWKIHPKWVYCKYHYLEGHEFDTPEKELLHFLEKMYDEDFRWESQYEEAKTENCGEGTCGRKTLEDDDYYCDRELVQRLIFDARNTYLSFSKEFRFNPEKHTSLNVSLRFMATMSGLTRWEYIDSSSNATDSVSSSSSNSTGPDNSTNMTYSEASGNAIDLGDSISSGNRTSLNDTIDCDNSTNRCHPVCLNTTAQCNAVCPNATADSRSRKKEFGDLNPRAINEKWYKSAVLQHQYDPEAFVYSVPFDSGCMDPDPLVTGSYAIFPSDGGREAPGSVVGFQFSQIQLRKRFQDISTNLTKEYGNCGRCNDSLTCYIVDSSGYIIVSFEQNDTGRFFGEVEGDILHSMLSERIFKQVTVFDYQAWCKISENEDSASSKLLTPFEYIGAIVQWMFVKIVYFFVELNLNEFVDQVTVLAEEMMSNDTDERILDTEEEEEESPTINRDDYYACETEINLYVLEQDLFIKEHFLGEIERPGIRNYYVKRIPQSNLIFVAINNTIKKNEALHYTTAPMQITKQPIFELHSMNTTLLPCQKLHLNSLPRRRLAGCYNEHALEHEIVDCGRAGYIKLNSFLFLFVLSIKFYL